MLQFPTVEVQKQHFPRFKYYKISLSTSETGRAHANQLSNTYKTNVFQLSHLSDQKVS